MFKFGYNNIKNISTKHNLFKLNCSYYLYILYKNDNNSGTQFNSIDILVVKF